MPNSSAAKQLTLLLGFGPIKSGDFTYKSARFSGAYTGFHPGMGVAAAGVRHEIPPGDLGRIWGLLVPAGLVTIAGKALK